MMRPLNETAIQTVAGLRAASRKTLLSMDPFQRCPDEFAFRWNRRRRRRSAFDTLLGMGLRLKPATCRDFVDGRA